MQKKEYSKPQIQKLPRPGVKGEIAEFWGESA